MLPTLGRVPKDDLSGNRTRRLTEQIVAILNSLLRNGGIEMTANGEFAVNGGVQVTEAAVAPGAGDTGYANGTIWIDNVADQVYILAGVKAGNAIWRGPV